MGLWSFSRPPPNKEKEKEKEEKHFRYVVLRRDLIDKWRLGKILTLIGHASDYAFCPNRGDPPTINSIHQVIVEVKGEPEILNLRNELKSGGIAHELWSDQSGNIPTCLATKPYPRSSLSPYFEKFQVID